MFKALLTGFFLGFSLIVAIGAQNAFVLRQGILGQHVFYIALFCAISDSLLITLGIGGISYFLKSFIHEFSKIIFGFSAIWLFIYGALRLRSAFRNNPTIITNISKPSNLLGAISIIAVFTFANPHVYLDTVILLGSISINFDSKFYFGLGAIFASFIFFFSLGYFSNFLSRYIKSPKVWFYVDNTMGLLMLFYGLFFIFIN